MKTDAVGRAGMTGSVEEFFCARSIDGYCVTFAS